MATVVHPGSGRVTASFAAVAKHYGVSVRPARRGAATARAWWRRPTTSPRSGGGAPWPTTSPPEQAQQLAGHLVRPPRGRPAARDRGRQGHRGHHRRRASRCARRRRRRSRRSCRSTAHGLGAGAGVLPRQPLLASPPELARAAVTVVRRLGAGHLDIATSGRDRDRPARAWRRPGPGSWSATTATSWPWNTAAMAAFSTGRAAPPQAAHPTRPRRPRRRRRPARRDQHRQPPARRRCRDRPRPLRRRRPRTEHPDHLTATTRRQENPMPAAHTTAPAPATAAQASLYQQLRGHLADAEAARRRRGTARRPRRTPPPRT